jgi:phosphonate transport system substrate-binding protein
MSVITSMSVLKRGRRGVFFFRSALVFGMAAIALLLGARSELFANAVERPFRMAYTYRTFTGFNDNDARAAMKVWIMTVAQEEGLPVDPDPNIHRTVEDLIRFARGNPVDGFGVTTPEYLALSREMSFDMFATASTEGRITEKYLLLIRKESGFDRLDQLAGRTLAVVDNPRMSLAVIWLDTVLLEAKRKRTSEFFRHIVRDRNVSQVVLPVFFSNIEACLVTLNSFEVMSELNPQLKQQLRMLAVSPPLVPAGFALRKDSKSVSRTKILDAMNRLGDSPAGRQILELAQTEKLEAHDISCLDESLELLNRHRRLLGNQ